MKALVFLFAFILISFCALAQEKTYFELCQNNEFMGTTIPVFKSGNKWTVRPECAPDTLYSWQPQKYVDWKNLDRNFLKNGAYLYTWRTPIGTSGYGDIQIRIKLRSDIKFTVIDEAERDCRTYSAEEKDNTVFVSLVRDSKVGMVDYLLCSNKVAHSWSVHTKAAGMEAMNEIQFINQNNDPKKFLYDAYAMMKGRTKPPMGGFIFILVDVEKKDFENWSPATMARKIRSLYNPDRPEMNKVYYLDGGQHDDGEHFQTKVHSYFKLNEIQMQAVLHPED